MAMEMDAMNLEARPKPLTKESSRTWFCYNPAIIHARLFTRFPFIMILLQVIMIVLLTFLTVYIHGPPTFEDASSGIEARGTPIHDRIIPLESFQRGDVVFSPTPNLSLNLVLNLSDTASTTDSTTVYTAGTPSIPICGNPMTAGASSFRAVYAPSSSAVELLTLDSLLSMCQQDDTFVRNSSTFKTVCTKQSDSSSQCCPSWSIPNYISALNGRSSCYDLTAEDIAFARLLLLECAPYYTSGALSAECGSGTNCTGVPSNCTTYNAIYFMFFANSPSDFSIQVAETGDLTLTTSLQIVSLNPLVAAGDRTLYNDAVNRRNVDNGITKIEAIGTNRLAKYFLISEPLMQDLIYAGVGGAIMILLIWVYLSSLFIAIMVIFEIIFSVALAYFFYYVVFRLTFFAFGNMLAIVLILGVGADDAFIFYDIFENTRRKHPDAKQEFILVETMKHAFPTMFVTSLTTASALFVNVASSVTNIRLYGIYSGTVVLCNFLFTMTWSPATAIIYDRHLRLLFQASSASKERRFHKMRNHWHTLRNFLRRIFEVYLPMLAFKLRCLWILLFTGLSIGALMVVFWKPQLRASTANTEFQIFTLKHPLERYDQVFRSTFDIERAKLTPLPFIVVWGTVPVDNGDPFDPGSRGHVQLDDSFNLDDPESQVWLLDFCSEVRQQGFYNSPSVVYEDCFIEKMKIFMETPCIPSSIGTDLSPCCGQTSFPYSADLLKLCAPKYAAYTCEFISGGCPTAIPGFRFDSENNINAFLIQFQSTAISQLEFAPAKEYYDTALAWVEEKVKTAPVGLQGGWFGTLSLAQPFYVDLIIQLKRDTPLALGLSLIIAMIVLLITNRNVLIAFYAALSIGGSVVTSVAIFVLIGWELKVFESVLIILTVGLATDFTIHYGVAYRLAPHDDRRNRAQYSLSTLASANTMAALSSFMIGAMMLPANVLIFYQLGIALEVVIAVSWSFGTFFFLPLCYVSGPQGTCCLIYCCCRKSKVDVDSGRSNENSGNSLHDMKDI
ncbi:protein dispatched homolog 1 isoform X1 [Strongylocentrotus purpuratus]|uniref:SSD domain-containing protein n=1 Tax=Strongylocentrotus purpuratus TaxID=7668 RepID=A0A7M7RHN1_STRPU|nr:protein dispatched homolog 1 isoform X1 [Strongylocentrotus purpuratus]|eukprot:XP_797561.2 PREDICTED: protein dispatched homolog 1 isoform X1 [Strongylocentrotus purpuratus]